MESLLQLQSLPLTEGLALVVTFVLQLFAALTIAYGSIMIFVRFLMLRYDQTTTHLRIRLARTIALGLEFYLAAEILKIISVRNASELYIVGALLVIRTVLGLLIHWEMKHGSEALEGEFQPSLPAHTINHMKSL